MDILRSEMQGLEERFGRAMAEITKAARESSVVELTGSSAVAVQRQQELQEKCARLPSDAEGEEILRVLGHLAVTTFLEEQLPAEQHFAIRHLMPPFAEKLKQRRLEEADVCGERPWIAWVCGAWRNYFEADREMMDALRRTARGWRWSSGTCRRRAELRMSVGCALAPLRRRRRAAGAAT